MAQKAVELSALNEGLTDLNLRSIEISNTFHKMLGELINTMKCRNCGTSLLDTEEEIRQCHRKGHIICGSCMKKSAKCAGCEGLEVTMVTNVVSTEIRNSIRKYDFLHLKTKTLVNAFAQWHYSLLKCREIEHCCKCAELRLKRLSILLNKLKTNKKLPREVENEKLVDPVTGLLVDRKCDCTEAAASKCVCISSEEDESSKGPGKNTSSDKSTVLGMADPRLMKKSVLTRGQARKRLNNDDEAGSNHDGGGGNDGKSVVRIPLAKKSSPPRAPPPSEIGDSPESPLCQLHDGDGTIEGHVCDACYDLIHEEESRNESLKTTPPSQEDDIVIVPHKRK